MFTKEGDLVLDPFAGYGSIPLVCELFNRRWIGIEIDPIKYEIAKKIISKKRVFDIQEMKEELRKRGQTGLTRYIDNNNKK
jgi:DNA modification methylase